jgi:hypothetical protein
MEFIDLIKEKSVPCGATYTKVAAIHKKKNVGLYDVLHFNSMHDIVRNCMEGYDKREWTGRLCYWKERDGESWTYGTEFPDAKTTATALEYGESSQKTISQIEKLRSALLNTEGIEDLMRQGRSHRRRRRFREEGAELDIDRVLSGDPRHWAQMSKGKRSNVIRLGVNFSLTCGHDERQFHKLAALITVSVDLLQACGFAVEVMGLCTAHGITNGAGKKATDPDKQEFIKSDKWEQGFTVPLKTSDEPLDVSKVACIGIPGLYRGYGFTTWCFTLDGKPKDSLGRGDTTSEGLKELLDIKHLLEVKWIDGKEQAFLTKILKSVTQEQAYVQQ